MNSNCAVRVLKLFAELVTMSCILQTSCGDQQMRAAHLSSSFYDVFAIIFMMFAGSELLVGEIGGDVKESATFIYHFGELLDHIMKCFLRVRGAVWE